MQRALVGEAHADPAVVQEVLPVAALPCRVVVVAVFGRSDQAPIVVVDVQARRIQAEESARILVLPALVDVIEADCAADLERRLSFAVGADGYANENGCGQGSGAHGVRSCH